MTTIEERESMMKATLAHAESCADVAVAQVLAKARRNIYPVMKQFDDFKELQLTPREQMLLNIVHNLENALNTSGI